MKKIKKTKLSLSTETIRNLDETSMKQAAGGWTNTCLGSACTCAPTYGADCPSGYTNCLCTFGYPGCATAGRC